MAFWYIFVIIWCIFSRFGMLHQEKSGNPACGANPLQLATIL
jgi:hypothetical protein